MCPYCESEEYKIVDFNEIDREDTFEQWWTCSCAKCAQTFYERRLYTLTKTEFLKDE